MSSSEKANLPEDDEPYPGVVTETTVVFAPKVQRRHIIKIQDFSDRVKNHCDSRQEFKMNDKFDITLGKKQTVNMVVRSNGIYLLGREKTIDVSVSVEAQDLPIVYKVTCSIYLTCVNAPRKFLLVNCVKENPDRLSFRSESITIDTIEAEPEKYMPNGTLTVICELEVQETHLNRA